MDEQNQNGAGWQNGAQQPGYGTGENAAQPQNGVGRQAYYSPPAQGAYGQPYNAPPYAQAAPPAAGNHFGYVPGPDPRYDYTPIGMWGYFGYNLLFAIPLVGFICILVFAFGAGRNINLRNYARSYFCLWILVLLLVIFFGFVLGGFAGGLWGLRRSFY